jgi:hypothetical protein
MKYERYTELLVTNDYLEYEFNSVGPKGSIRKLIQFTETPDELLVNLAFGNKKADGSIDDLARDNNKDRNKILATVVTVLKFFFEKYPYKCVFFTGSSPERTRLYRMAITLNLEELSTDFEIVGTLTNEDIHENAPFKKGINYFGFLVRAKKRTFKQQYRILLYETEQDHEGTEGREGTDD